MRSMRILWLSLVTGATPALAQTADHPPTIQVGGEMLLNGWYTAGPADVDGRPAVVPPVDPAVLLPLSSIGASARQTLLRATAILPDALGGRARGFLEVDFAGESGNGELPVPRLRRFRAEVAWPNAYVMAGQDAPPVAELDPSSLAARSVPEFGRSGNLWRWIPQARAGVRTRGATWAGLEGAALAPRAPFDAAADPGGPDPAERSGRPALEGRVRLAWGLGGFHGEASGGGHLGWIATTADTLVSINALVAGLRLAVTDHVEVRGELYSGEGLAGLDGEDLDRILGPGDLPVRSSGGWVQLNLRAATLELGGGLGQDDVTEGDLTLGPAEPDGRLRNRTWETHLHWRPGPLLLGFTYRRIESTYADPVGTRTLDHVNLAVGFGF